MQYYTIRAILYLYVQYYTEYYCIVPGYHACTNQLPSQLYQGRIEPPKAARGHTTHIDGIVLNVTKFRIQILCG